LSAASAAGTIFKQLICEGQSRLVVLFQTNIGHAGEWIDTILALRDSALPAPLVMSDALTSNHARVDPGHFKGTAPN
jgi:hypothetical protein